MSSIIYLNGNIITVDENIQNPEVVVVRDDKIEFVGSKEEALGLLSEDTVTTIDLEGKTMLPGFIDSHGHVAVYAPFMTYKNLSAPPVGETESLEQLLEQLKEFIDENNIAEDEWVIGYGYDNSLLKEKRHPTKFDLDKVSTKHKIYLYHASGHLSVLNSYALKEIGYDENSQNPDGGVIQRIEGSNEPNGIIEESAVLHAFSVIPKLTDQQIVDAIEKVSLHYASFGITTAQDGYTFSYMMEQLNKTAQENRIPIDVVAYPPIEEQIDFSKEYNNNLRIGGAKMSLDGSPQAKTAWLTKPYKVVPEGQNEDYCGYPTKTEEYVYNMCKKAIENNIQLITHTNGDAAIDQLLRCYEKALKDTNSIIDLRPVVIHAQTIREDQIDKVKELNAICSYFVDHTFYWGDWHIDSVLGEERAYKISPLKTSLDKGITCTTHQDSPVLAPDMIRTLNSCVNRITRNGRVCGENERISIMDAIKLLTINGAYQYFEEDIKGSITKGKLADLVILDKNPLDVNCMDIKDIKIVETIKRGKTIYKI